MSKYDGYFDASSPKQKETIAEKKMIGGELFTAMFLSMPLFSHTGTSTIAPPRPRAPPIVPARKPYSMDEFILAYDILSVVEEYT